MIAWYCFSTRNMASRSSILAAHASLEFTNDDLKFIDLVVSFLCNHICTWTIIGNTVSLFVAIFALTKSTMGLAYWLHHSKIWAGHEESFLLNVMSRYDRCKRLISIICHVWIIIWGRIIHLRCFDHIWLHLIFSNFLKSKQIIQIVQRDDILKLTYISNFIFFEFLLLFIKYFIKSLFSDNWIFVSI